MRSVYHTSAIFAVLLASTATSVFAADLSPAQPFSRPPVMAYDWSGPYVGIHAGYGWGSENDNQSRYFGGGAPTGGGGTIGGGVIIIGGVNVTNVGSIMADKFNVDGFVGGAHAGYNYQINQFVLGIEGDVDYSDIKGRHIFNGSVGTGSLSLDSKWQASARLRAGYAFDNLLIYATGGIATGSAELSTAGYKLLVIDNNWYLRRIRGSSSEIHIGWTAGAGVEYAFAENWIGRAEVRYTDFGKKTYDTPLGPVKSGWDQTTATLGVSYKF